MDKVKNNELEIEKNTTHEVHRLPYKYSLRDRLANYPALKVFQKALTLKEVMRSNYSIKQWPFSNFYAYSKNRIQKDLEINIVIASGRPFQAFFIGHQLKKDFPRIHWIPDYRDLWNENMNEILSSNNMLQRRLVLNEFNNEKKWSSNTSGFITVTKVLESILSERLALNGKTILNGYDKEFQFDIKEEGLDSKAFTLSFIGSLYEDQEISVLIESIKKLKDKHEINVVLLGSCKNHRERDLLSTKLKDIEGNYEILPRVDRNLVKEYIVKSDVLLLFKFTKHQGALPVKTFDYFKTNKPILLCPSDNDLMENFIKETNSGYIANTVAECTAILEQLIQLKKEGKPLIGPRNEENAHFYSRKYQTEVLADALDQLSQVK